MPKKLGMYLQSLTLQNFATFTDQKINFENSFNAITGETGSGKSLILDALQLILGNRAERKLIRKDCEFATVEAVFHCDDEHIKNFFYERGYPFTDNEVVIKRILFKTGASKSYLNHQISPVSILSEFAKKHIDLVGQFDNQKLLSETYQLSLLDFYAQNYDIRSAYQKIYAELVNTRSELVKIENEQNTITERQDYIAFQVNELEMLTPSSEDENKLINSKNEYTKLQEKLRIQTTINSIFEGSQNNVGLLSNLNQLSNCLDESILSIDELNSFKSAQEILNDLSYSINSNSSFEYSEEKLEEVMEKLDSYQKLKRKFSTDTEGLVRKLSEFKIELQNIYNFGESITAHRNRIHELENESYKIGQKLHLTRVDAAKNLSKELTSTIHMLNMDGATIDIRATKSEILTATGLSIISYQAETNPGEGFYRVKDIASGGELSRILLAIRRVLASKDSISIFLFDEIDTGIGGETALKIGDTLANVSNSSQVIAITHLPQLATYADKLIVVEKKTENARTFSFVSEVTGHSRKFFIERMNPTV